MTILAATAFVTVAVPVVPTDYFGFVLLRFMLIGDMFLNLIISFENSFTYIT